MREQLQQTIELLKKRVQHNLRVIHKNEISVREILQEPVSSERSERLDEKFGINKKMLEENNDSIRIQLSIIKFLDKFNQELKQHIENLEKNNQNFEEEIFKAEPKQESNYEIEELTIEDYFDLTIHKSLEYNEQHPYFNDKKFLQSLMEYFTDVEDYEMCSKIIAIHKKDDAFLN